MEVSDLRSIGVLLAAGGVCSDVYNKLRSNPGIDPVAICVTRACESDAMTSETLPFFPLTCPYDIAAYLQRHGINEVVHAGDLGVLRDAPAQFKADGSEYSPDPDMMLMLGKGSTIYAQLKVLEFRLRDAQIIPVHVQDLIEEFVVGSGWIGGAPFDARQKQVADQICTQVRELHSAGQLENSSRTTLVFDDLELRIEMPENTQLAVEFAGSTPRVSKGCVRTLVKLSTDREAVTLAAPTFCNEDMLHCANHGIDLVILDCDHLVFAERESCLATAAKHGISVIGMSFS